MSSMDMQPEGNAKLCRPAEDVTCNNAALSIENLEDLSPEKARQMLHELHVHQIELELQNEELRRAQAKLDVSQARYIDHYNLAPVGYVTISEKLKILETNLTAASLLGTTRSAMIKLPITRFILEEDQEIYYWFRKQLFETGEPNACELRMIKKDGTSFWAHLAATAGKDADGAPLSRVVLSDISERKQIDNFQRFLAQTSNGMPDKTFFEALARYLAENLSVDFVCIDRLDGDGLTARTIAVWCDGKFEDNVSYALKDTPCGQVVGKLVCCFPAGVRRIFPNDRVLQDLKAESYAGVTLFDHTGRPVGLIAVISRRPLANLPLTESMLKIVALRASGELERMSADESLQNANDRLGDQVRERTADLRSTNKRLCREIREHKKVVEQLLSNKRTITKVIDGISDPLIMLDAELRVKRLNRAAKDYYGLNSYQEAVGKPCFEGFRGKSSPCEGCKFPFSDMAGYAGSFDRIGMMNPDKREQVFVYQVKDEAGTPEAYIVRIYDATQAKILEKQLIHNEKLASLGLLVSGIAHEINNPNTFISFNIPILREYLQELIVIVDMYDEKHPGFEPCGMPYRELRKDIFSLLDNMEHGSSRINTTVSTLKEFSRTQSNAKKSFVALKPLIDKALTICGTEIRKRVKSLKVAIPDDLPPLFLDPGAIEQVMINLLINAVHALDKEDSQINISVRPDYHHDKLARCLIEVADNGSGMDEDVKRMVFEPFFTTKSSAMGTGLGLYVCQNLVGKLGGNIEVDSHPGTGSIFRVILPNVQAVDDAPPAAKG